MRNMLLLVALLAMISAPAYADDTAYIQGLINANVGGATRPPCGYYVVNGGLTVPTGGMDLGAPSNRCVFLEVTSNVNVIGCSGINSIVRISDIVIVGNASPYTGYGTGPTSSGQNGIQIHNCSNFSINNVSLALLNGNGIDCDEPSSGFNANWFGVITAPIVEDDYKGIYTHNGCEYISIENAQGRNNVYGMDIASGNVNATNNQFSYNSIGIKIEGDSSNPNPCHGLISNSAFNHNTYDAVIESCGVGETFSGDNFISDQSGGLGAYAQILIYNSHGVAFVGGQLGANVSVTAADPITGSTALNGENLISQMYVRTDLTNFAAPVLNTGTSMLIKGNFDGSGLWSANN